MTALKMEQAEKEADHMIDEKEGDVVIVQIYSEDILDHFLPSLAMCMADFKARTGTDQNMGAVYLAIRDGLRTAKEAVWLAVRKSDRAVVGYLVAHETKGLENEPECFVWQAYAMAGDIFKLGWAHLELWARERGWAKISFITNRNDEAMARKLEPYGFKKKSTLFEVKLHG